MDGAKTIKYSNIFLSCYSDNARSHTPMIKEHWMVYVMSGVLEINENKKITG